MTAKRPVANFKTSGKARAWQRMLSGRRLDLLDPSPLDIEIEDIAHGIARVPRWNGQTKGPHIYSVAQHTLLVDTLVRQQGPVDDKLRLAILLHDAPEYVVGDMITPFKAVIGDSYKAVEHRLLAAIHVRFGLPPKLPVAQEKWIKAADRAAAYLEATRLAGFEEAEARRFFGAATETFAGLGARLSRPPGPRKPRKRAIWNASPSWSADTFPSSRAMVDGATRIAQPRSSVHQAKKMEGRVKPGQDQNMIHVCSLARLHDTVAETGAKHIVTLMKDVAMVRRPQSIVEANHLLLDMDDIVTEMDGYVPPNEQHVGKLIDFVTAWDRSAPIVVHCYAGISRSTAGAFITACALNPTAMRPASRARSAPSHRPRNPISAWSRLPMTCSDRKGRMTNCRPRHRPGPRRL